MACARGCNVPGSGRDEEVGMNKQRGSLRQSLSEARWAGRVSVELVQAAKRIMGRYD